LKSIAKRSPKTLTNEMMGAATKSEQTAITSPFSSGKRPSQLLDGQGDLVRIASRSWLLGVAYLVAYVALDALSYVQPLLKLGITPWNPDAGLTLAFLLYRGWRQAPWTAAAALAAELLVRDAPAPLLTLVCASVVIACGYGALAFTLSRRGLDHLLASRRAALEFSFGAALTALVVASGYAATFVLAGVLPMSSVGDAIARNWVGDLNGVLTLTPLLLAAPAASRAWPALRGHGGIIASQAVVLAALAWLLFRVRPSGDLPLLYVLFAPVIWITLTWGVTGASAATLLIQIGFIASAAPRLSAASLLEIQYLLVTLALTATLLGAVLAERASALARVAAGEAEQRALLATAPDAVLATNLAGEITSANLAAQRLLGASETAILGTTLARWLPDLVLNDPVERRRLSGAHANGERFPVEIACVHLDPPARAGYLLIARDMTEHDNAQIQLRERDTALARAMRFALAGELSTALTHELNQPITALVSYLRAVEILASPLEPRDSRLNETLYKATREALRASDILKRLRDFYRGGVVNVTVVNVEALVAEVFSAFADRAVRLGVEITQDIRVTREVPTDRIQLQMVLHNLLANALDALGDVAPTNRRLHLTLTTDDELLRVMVEDSGCGVPPEIRSQLFEPFVTSKFDGMGLGLAISRSLLRSQGGELRLDAPGAGGTRFLVELPLKARTRTAA
jgi:two-component system, LuxR family, sensor kinase FixL